ncbi:hypothetical protein A2U01_0063584, partial [Trifolium medium]|nr:hypothetical protein [Trifolium medium]
FRAIGRSNAMQAISSTRATRSSDSVSTSARVDGLRPICDGLLSDSSATNAVETTEIT